jgi:hypothetical protein
VFKILFSSRRAFGFLPWHLEALLGCLTILALKKKFVAFFGALSK